MLKRFLLNQRANWHLFRDTPQARFDGVVLAVASGDIPRNVRQQLFKDKYEKEERNFVRRAVKKGDRVLEIGSGIGFVGLVAAKIAGEGNVLCYEANSAMEPVIRKNYELNGITPDLRMKAITADGKPVTFFVDPGVLSSSMVDRNIPAKKVTVKSDALGKVLKQYDPDVLIMDVEGAETELFLKPLPKRLGAIIIETHAKIVGQDAIDTVIAQIEKNGFRLIETQRDSVLFER